MRSEARFPPLSALYAQTAARPLRLSGAIRLGLLTSTTPESWLAGQSKWDLWQA